MGRGDPIFDGRGHARRRSSRVRGIERPRGRALVGTVLFGALGMGLSTVLIYRGLVDTPAGVAQVILALVPLETLLFAVALSAWSGSGWRG